MKRSIPLVLVLSVLAAGCLGPMPSQPRKTVTRPPITYTTTESKVEVMTKTFSMAENPGLKKAAESFKELAASLSGAFGAAAASGGSMAASDLVQTVRTAGYRATYQVASEWQQGGATFVYDEATSELTAITSQDAEIRFRFANEGATRSWEATIVRSPDGTTGSFFIEATSPSWKPIPLMPPMFAPPPARPLTPPAAPVPAPEPEATEEAAASEEATATEASAYALAQADDGRAPFTVFANEYPESVEKLSFRFAVKPRGDAKLAVEFSGTLDEPAAMPTGTMRVPTHWVYQARVPSVRLDWESRLGLAPGKATFKGDGAMTVDVEAGQEKFLYALTFDEAQRSGGFNLTNEGARVRLSITASQPSTSRPPVYKSVLVSTEDGSEIGTVKLDERRPRFALVTFKDGSTMEWELYPAELMSGFLPATQPR